MRRAVWALAAFVLVSASGRAAADDAPSGDAGSGNFFTRLFSGGKKTKTEAKKDDAHEKEAAAEARAGVALAAAKTTYFERLKVCNKLREIALQGGDEELLRKAEQLEIRVWDAYQNQMRRFASGSTLSAEERALDSHIGAEPSAGRGRSVPDSSSAARR